MGSPIGRRGFVKSLAGVGAASVIGASSPGAFPQAPAPQAQPPSSRSALPARGEFVIRNGYILTMDPALGDISNGDIHVKDGVIVAVGAALRAPSATVLDARKMIVLPGLVDTHWHMWTTYLRCMAGDKMEDGYFPVTTAYGQAMLPEDMYRSTKLAATEAIYSGITTLND
jgi:5-methylthioadenosine/S-adenosylhomocysteine deaminase